MYDDYKEFGWQFVKEMYMPNGIIPRWFEYLKALDRLVTKLAKERHEEQQFTEKVHGSTIKMAAKSPTSRITRIREVKLPPGAENETFW
jgi:hypothetical protein